MKTKHLLVEKYRRKNKRERERKEKKRTFKSVYVFVFVSGGDVISLLIVVVMLRGQKIVKIAT